MSISIDETITTYRAVGGVDLEREFTDCAGLKMMTPQGAKFTKIQI